MASGTARGLAVAVVLGAAAVRGTPAAAQTMGEQMVATGIHGTLAGTSAGSAAPTLNSVKNSLGKSVPKLASGSVKPSGPGSGRPGMRKPGTGGQSKSASSSKSGWGSATKGWAKQGAATGKSGGSWAKGDGGWAKSEGWESSDKAWVSSSQNGGGWARPGKKS